jgi:hypothetical protein
VTHDKPGDLWDYRPDTKSPWQRIEITNVSDGEVEFKILDMLSGTPDPQRTKRAYLTAMRANQRRYRRRVP